MGRKLFHLNQTASEGMKRILSKYTQVIVNSFEDILQSTVAVTHRFELILNSPTYQKAMGMSLCTMK